MHHSFPSIRAIRILSSKWFRPLLFVATLSLPAQADPSVQIAWRLLDYIAVDYRQAVHNGKVVNPGEFAEMSEFAKSAREKIDALPDTAAKKQLQKEAAELQQAISQKASAESIAFTSRALASELIGAYPIPLSPTTTPDIALGKEIYSKQCATCHGPEGDGKGPAAQGLTPPPIAFRDRSRAKERSIFALYQVIDQGLDGTSMPSFASLPASDRWALAFYVGSFAYPEEEASKGSTIWKQQPSLSQKLTMEKLVGITPAELEKQLGGEQAPALIAYLRRTPAVLAKQPAGSLDVARQRLQEAVSAYDRGDKRSAATLALSAYLDGFEPLEPLLASRDSALLGRVEEAMSSLRSSITRGDSKTVQGQAQALRELFSQVETAISSNSSSAASSFFGAFAILLREGLEALLVVVAMLGFLRKAERKDLIPYVHSGWLTALMAGGLTWGVATWIITISGATRELTEGLGSVFAALILLWVGVWMHAKSNAEVWQRYVRENLTKALNSRSGWFLFGLSFLVVYREAFETILFYAAIWRQGQAGAVLSGAATACVLLAGIAVGMLHYSRSLPMGKFFAYSSSLMALLSVVLIGKGVSALQEAGYCSVHHLASFPRIEVLGFYPTLETAAAQIAITGLLVMGFSLNGTIDK